MNQAPFFNSQFFDNDGAPLAGGKLYTYVSGTTTPQTTYQDEAGASPNTNPIILDAAGRCELWLDPADQYTLKLTDAEDVLISTWDDVVGAAAATGLVTSVNTETGDVTLTADDIGFTTGTSTSWFVGTDTSAALDAIIDKVDDLSGGSASLTAADVAIVDSGGYYTATNVETALAEVAVEVAALALPSQGGNSGKFLTTNGTAASWAAVALPAFTASIAGGDITTSVGTGDQSYGTRTVTATGGTAPYTYCWIISPGQAPINDAIYIGGTRTAATVTLKGYAVAVMLNATAICLVTDSTGRMTSAQIDITATHA